MRVLDDGYVGIAPVAGRAGERRDRARSIVAAALAATGRRVGRGAIVAADPADRRRRRGRGGTAEPLDAVAGASPLGHRVTRRAGDRWLLVGDAAGFLDPFTGEGLHRALVSAELGGRGAILAARPRPATARSRAYERAMQPPVPRPRTRVSWLVQAFLARPAAVRVRRAAGRRPHRPFVRRWVS